MRSSWIILTALLALLTAAAFWAADIEGRARQAPPSSVADMVSVTSPVGSDAATRNLPEGSPTEPTMQELVELGQHLLTHIRHNVHDYTATLVKRERIAGQLGPETRMALKLRHPASGSGGPSVYLKFLEPVAQRGREVIWSADRPQGKLIAHEGGLLNLLSVELDPHGTLAMLGNKYPITEIGLVRLLEKMLEKIDRQVDLSQCQIEVREHQRVGDRECRLFQVTQPRHIPGADFYIAQFFLDTERQLPLRYAAFLWPTKEGGPPPLEEEYTYLDLRTNVGLNDADFDPDNPQYQFP